MKQIQLAIVVCAFLIGCAWLGTAVKKTLDVVLCEAAAAELPPAELAGLSAEDWCKIAVNLLPFQGLAEQAKAAAAHQAGASRAAP